MAGWSAELDDTFNFGSAAAGPWLGNYSPYAGCECHFGSPHGRRQGLTAFGLELKGSCKLLFSQGPCETD